jgi:FtsP/CotA-like multicopper oxidase with cupredoxin domain
LVLVLGAVLLCALAGCVGLIRMPVARAGRAVIGAVLVAAAAALALAGASGASQGGPLSTAQMVRGMHAGLPFADPPNLASGAKLTAAVTRFDLSGREVWGESYNGSFVGPTLRFRPGEQVTLKLVNRLPVLTNIHFHGMQISPSGASDNPFIAVTPGSAFTYRLSIPAGHPQGTFWYHDHGMVMEPGMPGMPMSGMPMSGMSMPAGSSPTKTVGSDVESQIFAGLSGTILVGDDRSLLPRALRHITAHTLVLKDVQIDRAGRIVQNTRTSSIDSGAPTVRLVNGELRPVLSIRPGETQLWRLANEGADIFYDLALAGAKFTVIGADGVPAARVTTRATLLMPPGRRYDVLVTAPAHPGEAWLQTLAYSNGPQGDSYPAAELLKLNVAGRAARPARMPSGAIPTAPASLAGAPIAQYRTLGLGENSAGTSFSINGEAFDPSTSIFSTPGVANTVEQWTVVNDTAEVHPFHVHTNHFQVLSINGVPQPYTGMVDTIPVPPTTGLRHGSVVIRIALADFTGKWMFHCHIAAHEDNGMMSYLNVVSAPAPAR